MPMKTLPAKVTPKLLEEIDDLVEEGWYSSRSEAVRDAIRQLVQRQKKERIEKAMEEDIEWGLYGED
ncbi:MAG: ribbon-helix-helix domain-containing protein [Thermoplasmata archaeon]